jgi:hypothetical protein
MTGILRETKRAYMYGATQTPQSMSGWYGTQEVSDPLNLFIRGVSQRRRRL